MYFDRFDICAAYAALNHDYNSDPAFTTVSIRLKRMGYSNPFKGEYDHLTENGKEIYNNVVARLNLPMFIESSVSSGHSRLASYLRKTR